MQRRRRIRPVGSQYPVRTDNLRSLRSRRSGRATGLPSRPVEGFSNTRNPRRSWKVSAYPATSDIRRRSAGRNGAFGRLTGAPASVIGEKYFSHAGTCFSVSVMICTTLNACLPLDLCSTTPAKFATHLAHTDSLVSYISLSCDSIGRAVIQADVRILEYSLIFISRPKMCLCSRVTATPIYSQSKQSLS